VAKIPAPPQKAQRKVISFRFSDDELAQLDRVRVLLAKRWKQDKVERSEAMRAALTMLLDELEGR
jgi:hypothetical protein